MLLPGNWEKVCNGDKLESCNAFSIRLISVPSNKGNEKKESMNIDDVGVTKKYENVKRKVHHCTGIEQLRIRE